MFIYPRIYRVAESADISKQQTDNTLIVWPQQIHTIHCIIQIDSSYNLTFLSTIRRDLKNLRIKASVSLSGVLTAISRKLSASLLQVLSTS